jgi:hypothetical protein
MKKKLFVVLLVLLFFSPAVFAEWAYKDWSFNYGSSTQYNNQSIGVNYTYAEELHELYNLTFGKPPIFNLLPGNLTQTQTDVLVSYNYFTLYQCGVSLISDNTRGLEGVEVSLSSSTYVIDWPSLMFNSGVGFLSLDNNRAYFSIKFGMGVNISPAIISISYNTYRGLMLEVSLNNMQEKIKKMKPASYEQKIKKLEKIKSKIDEEINVINTEKLNKGTNL